MADAPDSKSGPRKGVWVQVPPSVVQMSKGLAENPASPFFVAPNPERGKNGEDIGPALILRRLSRKVGLDMASLEKRPHGYRVVFMFRGEKIARSLQTKDPKQAKATLARMEDTLRRLELGTLLMPEPTQKVLTEERVITATRRTELTLR